MPSSAAVYGQVRLLGNRSATRFINHVFGEASPVSLEFEIFANTNNEWRLTGTDPYMESSADYLHTITLAGIAAQGLDEGEWSLTTQTGHNYLGGQPVPIPPTILLLAPGLLGLAAMRRTFKK